MMIGNLRRVFEVFGDEPVYGGPEFIKDAIVKAEEVIVSVLKDLALLPSGAVPCGR